MYVIIKYDHNHFQGREQSPPRFEGERNQRKKPTTRKRSCRAEEVVVDATTSAANVAQANTQEVVGGPSNDRKEVFEENRDSVVKLSLADTNKEATSEADHDKETMNRADLEKQTVSMTHTNKEAMSEANLDKELVSETLSVSDDGPKLDQNPVVTWSEPKRPRKIHTTSLLLKRKKNSQRCKHKETVPKQTHQTLRLRGGGYDNGDGMNSEEDDSEPDKPSTADGEEANSSRSGNDEEAMTEANTNKEATGETDHDKETMSRADFDKETLSKADLDANGDKETMIEVETDNKAESDTDKETIREAGGDKGAMSKEVIDKVAMSKEGVDKDAMSEEGVDNEGLRETDIDKEAMGEVEAMSETEDDNKGGDVNKASVLLLDRPSLWTDWELERQMFRPLPLDSARQPDLAYQNMTVDEAENEDGIEHYDLAKDAYRRTVAQVQSVREAQRDQRRVAGGIYQCREEGKEIFYLHIMKCTGKLIGIKLVRVEPSQKPAIEFETFGEMNYERYVQCSSHRVRVNLPQETDTGFIWYGHGGNKHPLSTSVYKFCERVDNDIHYSAANCERITQAPGASQLLCSNKSCGVIFWHLSLMFFHRTQANHFEEAGQEHIAVMLLKSGEQVLLWTDKAGNQTSWSWLEHSPHYENVQVFPGSLQRIRYVVAEGLLPDCDFTLPAYSSVIGQWDEPQPFQRIPSSCSW